MNGYYGDQKNPYRLFILAAEQSRASATTATATIKPAAKEFIHELEPPSPLMRRLAAAGIGTQRNRFQRFQCM